MYNTLTLHNINREISYLLLNNTVNIQSMPFISSWIKKGRPNPDFACLVTFFLPAIGLAIGRNAGASMNPALDFMPRQV